MGSHARPIGRPEPTRASQTASALALSGRQKAAVIVRFLLSEGAELPLRALSDDMQAALTEQIATMRTVDHETLAAVVEEFCSHLERIGLSFPGGIEEALKVLDGRISPTAASNLRRSSGSAANSDPWARISQLDPAQLLPILAEESIEVAAIILSKLAVAKAAELLGQMPGDRARRVAYSISQTSGVAPETVRLIGQSLIGQIDAQPVRAFEGDPTERVGAILNVSTSATRDDVLRGLDEADKSVAHQVRKQIFTFAHIPHRIAARDVPKIIRGIEQATLLTALGGAEGEAAVAAEFILANMSQRMAASLREEMAALGKVKEKDAETAQTTLILAIRDLEAAGELKIVMPDVPDE
ncbi:MAG: FliG C-terminal domain-containing protein [Paracoccaceae bacterium]